MVGLLRVGRNSSSEPKDWYLLVCVIVLQDGSDRPNRVQVLVLLHVKIVQRGRLVRAAIRESEIYSNGQANLAASEDVFQKRVSLIDFESAELELMIAEGLLLFVCDEVFTGSFLQRG